VLVTVRVGGLVKVELMLGLLPFFRICFADVSYGFALWLNAENPPGGCQVEWSWRQLD
jgi:hypothetical protein